MKLKFLENTLKIDENDFVNAKEVYINSDMQNFDRDTYEKISKICFHHKIILIDTLP